MYYHPKYYKELRKRNRSFLLRKEECTLGKLGNRRLGETPSDKIQAEEDPQAPSLKLQASKASSKKLQAPHTKLQASSRKLQAP